MKRFFILAVGCLSLMMAAVPYVDVRNIERAIDRRLDSYSVADPIDVIGVTHGIYIEGTGAVFTSELNLAVGPVLTPFRQNIPKDDIVKLHDRKKARLPELRKLMQDTLVSTATGLPTVPPQEEIVYGVTMFYYAWEDATGMPHQIVMRATRQSLIDFEKGKLKSLEGAVRTQEF